MSLSDFTRLDTPCATCQHRRAAHKEWAKGRCTAQRLATGFQCGCASFVEPIDSGPGRSEPAAKRDLPAEVEVDGPPSDAAPVAEEPRPGEARRVSFGKRFSDDPAVSYVKSRWA